MMYGYHNIFMSGTDLDAPEAYMFDEDIFKAGGEIITDGLKDAVHAIAERVAKHLRSE